MNGGNVTSRNIKTKKRWIAFFQSENGEETETETREETKENDVMEPKSVASHCMHLPQSRQPRQPSQPFRRMHSRLTHHVMDIFWKVVVFN